MNIENLLRETLSEMADEERPPAPDRFLQRWERRPRRRRGLALAAATAVAAMAVGSTLVVQAISSQAPGEVQTSNEIRTATVTVAAGMRLSKVFKELSSLTGRPVADFERAARDGTALGLPPYAKGRLEGFLSPGAYKVSSAMSPSEILRAMVAGFRASAEATGLVEGARRAGRTPLEILTVASIVQAEANTREDMPKIARVIYNRLDLRMRLQMSSTVRYGLDKDGDDVTSEDLRSPSPYNTFRRAGLPPGPIGSPGEDAVRAALKPASGSWRYFVTVDPDTGETKFAGSPSGYADLVEERNKK